VDEAERRVDYLFATVERLDELVRAGLTAPGKLPPELLKLKAELEAATTQGEAALDDDLNTPVALAALGEMMRIGNETVMLAQKRKKDASFVGAAGVLGRHVTLAIGALTKQLGLLNVSPADYAARVKAPKISKRSWPNASKHAKPKTSPKATPSAPSFRRSASPSPIQPKAAQPGRSLNSH
jgi:cysteinyl-tRNA synthetase